MAEVTIATLLASGALVCWRGWKTRHRRAERTIELHTDGILYCFEEPRNSMTKTLKERISLQGATVVDCGTHRGRLCFGIEVASLSCIEQLDWTGTLASLRTCESVGPSAHARDCVMLFFTGDKQLKWRFVNLLRSVAQQKPDESTNVSEGATQDCNADTHGVYRQLLRPPRIIDESGDEPLDGHEVEQLANVLKTYEAQQRRRQLTEIQRVQSPDCRLYSENEEWNETTIKEEADALSEPPERLTHSPLFDLCIANQLANRWCADCNATWPTWAVLRPVGGFVCIHCVGVHRQMWPEKCRELQLDKWNSDDIAFMTRRGNKIINEELEYGGYETADKLHGTVYKPVRNNSPSDLRERFIYFKYKGYFSRERYAATQAERIPPPLDPGAITRDMFIAKSISFVDTGNGSHSKEGPMRYIGVACVTIKEVEGVHSKGAVLALTNGFQEVRSRPATSITLKGSDTSLTTGSCCTRWDESLHIGIHNTSAPLYVALYSSADELIGVSEWTLCSAGKTVTEEPQLVTVPLMWWTGNPKKQGLYGFFASRPDRTSGNDGGGVGTTPLIYLFVSFSQFG